MNDKPAEADAIGRGRIEPPTLRAIQEAAELLRAGDLIGLPTETVYGLGADARNPEAVRRIFAAKGRPADHPVIVHLPDASHLERWAASVPRDAQALARAFWPGPLTLILKRGADVADEVTGGQDSVGLRVPAHSIALAVLQTFGSGIAAPSANRFGRISPTTAAHVRDELGDAVAMVIDGGQCTFGIESTIVDFSRGTPLILRPGRITADDIARVIGRRPQLAGVARDEDASDYGGHMEPEPLLPAEPVRAPGTLAAHYAPRTPLQLLPVARLADEARRLAGKGRRVAVLARTPMPEDLADQAALIWRTAAADPAPYGHQLYASLRELDEQGAAAILVEAPPTDSVWHAIADRLQRAAAGSADGIEAG